MGQIFLGKWWHWLVIGAIVFVLELAGSRRLHVIEFNTFVIALFIGIGLVVVGLLAGTRTGEQVTRDVIEPEAVDD